MFHHNVFPFCVGKVCIFISVAVCFTNVKGSNPPLRIFGLFRYGYEPFKENKGCAILKMKLLKKIVALTAIAACVVTMSTPVVAKADDVAVCAVSGCHDGYHISGREIYLGRFSSSSTHISYSEAECVITTIFDIYEIVCECGQVSYGTRQSFVREIHSMCP